MTVEKIRLRETVNDRQFRILKDKLEKLERLRDLAKEKWLSALFELEHRSPRDEDTIKEHRLVAEKLGWLKREQTK